MLEKKGNWRVWRDKYMLAEKEIDRLKQELEKEKTAPTHIWRRIKTYFFGSKGFYGKICTVIKWHNDSKKCKTVFLFGTWICYSSVIRSVLPSEGKKYYIRLFIGNRGIECCNYGEKRVCNFVTRDEEDGECASG
jgi:hypothetical protein